MNQAEAYSKPGRTSKIFLGKYLCVHSFSWNKLSAASSSFNYLRYQPPLLKSCFFFHGKNWSFFIQSQIFEILTEGVLFLGRFTKLILLLHLDLKILDERSAFLQCWIAVSNMLLEGCLQLAQLGHSLIFKWQKLSRGVL